MTEYDMLMLLAVWLVIVLQIFTITLIVFGCMKYRFTKSSFVKPITFPRLKSMRHAPISTQESGHHHFGYY
jgi:hypothetical protein